MTKIKITSEMLNKIILEEKERLGMVDEKANNQKKLLVLRENLEQLEISEKMYNRKILEIKKMKAKLRSVLKNIKTRK